MSQVPLEPERHEHAEGYDSDVPDVDQLEPDYEVEETDEVVELVEEDA